MDDMQNIAPLVHTSFRPLVVASGTAWFTKPEMMVLSAFKGFKGNILVSYQYPVIQSELQ